MRLGWFLVLVIVAIFALGQCGKRADDGRMLEPAQESTVQPTAPSETEDGMPFNVASDPRASYRLLKWLRMQNGNIESVTVRDGPSGVSYARREINCDDRTFRYLGEGDTAQEAMRNSPAIGEMAELVPGSIADVTVDVVCAEARR